MVHGRELRRPPLPDRLIPAERDFYLELRRLVDTAGYSFRTLEDVTSGNQSFFSKSQWGRWLNGQSLPPRRAVRALADRLAADDIDAGHLTDLWECAFVPTLGQQTGATTGCPQQLPIAPPAFTGRAPELDFLIHLAERTADGQNNATLVAVIQGTAGVGKTTLAVHLAHRIRNLFRDGQLFVNLRGFDETAPPAGAGTVLLNFLDSLGAASDKVPASVDGSAALYRSMLSGRRVLIVLDNAPDPDHVRCLLPASPGCLVLVTSRDQMTGLIAEGAHLLRLDPFSLAEARALLADRIGVSRAEQEPDAVDELIGLCARLPLALSVAGAYAAAHPQFSLAELVGEFRSHRLDLFDTGDPATTARSVFAGSYQHLTEPAARVFRLLGTHPGPDISLAAAASLAGLPTGEARKALSDLARASLLAEPARGRFVLHDLLAAYAGELARGTDGDEQIAAAERRLFAHYLHTTDNAVRRLYPTTPQLTLEEQPTGTAPEAFRSHQEAQAWLSAELPVLLATLPHAAGRAPALDTYCWQLPRLLGNTLEVSGRSHDHLACQRIALAAAQRTGDPQALGHAHSGFGYACMMLGDTEAAWHHLDLALEALTAAGDRAAAAAVRSRLAMLLEHDGRYAEALEQATEALRLREAFGNRAAIAHTENVTGWIFARIGQHVEGIRHCERALDLATETGSRSLAADVLDSLGMITLGLGDHERALEYYRQALTVFRETGFPRGVFSALTGIGDARLAAGDSQAAREAWQQALDTAEQVPGIDVQHIKARLSRC